MELKKGQKGKASPESGEQPRASARTSRRQGPNRIAAKCNNPLELPEVMETILPFLETEDLRSARLVSQLWQTSAGPVIKEREQTVQLNGVQEIGNFLNFLRRGGRGPSTEIKTWNLKYSVKVKFTWKFEQVLNDLAAITAICGRIEALNIFGNYHFRADRWAGLTPAADALIVSLFPHLLKLTINDNTLSPYDETAFEPMANLVTAIIPAAPGLTHLILDHSVRQSIFLYHVVYDMIAIRAMFLDLSPLHHLEVMITDPHAIEAFRHINLPNLVHFKFCIVRQLTAADTQHVRFFLETNCPKLRSLELESHNVLYVPEQDERPLDQQPIIVQLPNLLNFVQMDRVNPSDELYTKMNPIVVHGSRSLECVQINMIALIINTSHWVLNRAASVTTLVFILDEECARELHVGGQTRLNESLAKFANVFGKARKVTIAITSLDFDPQPCISMVLSAFAGKRVETLEIRNYHQDFLGHLVSVRDVQLLATLNGLHELIIPPLDPHIMIKLKEFNGGAKPGAFRLDLDKILHFMPQVQQVHLPTRFGFSWIPDAAMLRQTRQNELEKIRARYPSAQINFF